MGLGFRGEVTDSRLSPTYDVVSELIINSEKYPLTKEIITKYQEGIEASLFDTPEEARESFLRRVQNESGESGDSVGFVSTYILHCIMSGEFISPQNQSIFIDEVISAALGLFKQKYGNENLDFSAEMVFAKRLVSNLIIPFWEKPEEFVTLRSEYDLRSWTTENYRGILSDFKLTKPVDYTLKANALDLYKQFISRNHQKSYNMQSAEFFRTFRSSYTRRHIFEEFSPNDTLFAKVPEFSVADFRE